VASTTAELAWFRLSFKNDFHSVPLEISWSDHICTLLSTLGYGKTLGIQELVQDFSGLRKFRIRPNGPKAKRPNQFQIL